MMLTFMLLDAHCYMALFWFPPLCTSQVAANTDIAFSQLKHFSLFIILQSHLSKSYTHCTCFLQHIPTSLADRINHSYYWSDVERHKSWLMNQQTVSIYLKIYVVCSLFIDQVIHEKVILVSSLGNCGVFALEVCIDKRARKTHLAVKSCLSSKDKAPRVTISRGQWPSFGDMSWNKQRVEMRWDVCKITSSNKQKKKENLARWKPLLSRANMRLL